MIAEEFIIHLDSSLSGFSFCPVSLPMVPRQQARGDSAGDGSDSSCVVCSCPQTMKRQRRKIIQSRLLTNEKLKYASVKYCKTQDQGLHSVP